MGKDGVTQRGIGESGDHRDLHACHDFSCLHPEDGEAKDAIALGSNEGFHEAPGFGKRSGSQYRHERDFREPIGNARSFASVSLRPMRASSGSVNKQNGTCRPVVTRWPPRILSCTMWKSFSEMCVKCGLPAHSPAAQTSGAVVSRRSFTLTYARLVVSTPARSRPIPSVLGVRPVATRRCVPWRTTSEPSRLALSFTDSPDLPSTRVIRVLVTTSIPSSLNNSCRAAEMS